MEVLPRWSPDVPESCLRCPPRPVGNREVETRYQEINNPLDIIIASLRTEIFLVAHRCVQYNEIGPYRIQEVSFD